MVGVWSGLGIPSLSYGFYVSFLAGLLWRGGLGWEIGWDRLRMGMRR